MAGSTASPRVPAARPTGRHPRRGAVSGRVRPGGFPFGDAGEGRGPPVLRWVEPPDGSVGWWRLIDPISPEVVVWVFER